MKIHVCEWIQKSEKRRIAILTRIDFAAADSPAGGARVTSLWTFDSESEAPPSGHLINICHNYLQEPQGNGSVTSSRGRETRTEGGWGGRMEGGREGRMEPVVVALRPTQGRSKCNRKQKKMKKEKKGANDLKHAAGLWRTL